MGQYQSKYGPGFEENGADGAGTEWKDYVKRDPTMAPPSSYSPRSWPDAGGKGLPKQKQPFIIGYSARFPGCDDLKELWHNLENKIDCVGPSKRYPEGHLELPARAGHLNEINKFDAKHFRFNKQQVAKLCPQNRLLLEVSEEALLDARLDIAQMRGSKTGVYVGASSSDYHANVLSGVIDGYENVGGDMSMAANKISYHYDFRGPSCSYSTACSSSLVAFNEAINALNSGEIDYALVAGASLHLRAQVSKSFAQYNMLSPTGTCHVFDKDADGYCRSEGIAVIVISRVHDAGYARVLASGSNHDGYTKQGITFPNGKAQVEIIQDTLKKCGNPEIEYVEAHGTGTTAGDGVETKTFATCFPQGVKIGSIKSNVGHSEVVSGLFAVIKCLLAYEFKQIPPNIHYYDTPHDVIKKGILNVCDEMTQFDSGNCLIMNYGFGGSNACAILGDGGYKYESYEGRYIRGFGNSSSTPSVHLNAQPYNRSLYGMRTVYDKETQRLEAKAVGKESPKLAMVFTGRGCTRANMGKELLEGSEIFRQTIERLDGYIKNWEPKFELLKMFESGVWKDPRYFAPGITAFQIATTNMLRAQGIRPDFILGHSVGEFGASYCDGAVTEEECILLVVQREAAMRKVKPNEMAVDAKTDMPLPCGRRYHGRTWLIPRTKLESVRHLCEKIYAVDGVMVVVGMTAEEITAVMETSDAPNCLISCYNSPSGITISGPNTEIDRVLGNLDEDVFRRKLKTPTAFHNHWFIPPAIGKDISVDLRNRKMTHMVSTVDMSRKDITVNYFIDNMISPVKFYQAVNSLPANTVMLEVGPRAILLGQVMRTRKDVSLVPMIRSPADETPDLMDKLLNKLWLANYNIFSEAQALPSYVQLPLKDRVAQVWDHSVEYEVEKDNSDQGTRAIKYDLLGKDAYILDHKINNAAIFPAAGHLYTVWGVIGHNKQVKFSKYKILQSVPIEDVDSVEFAVSLVEVEANHYDWKVFSEQGMLVASGKAQVLEGASPDVQQKRPTEPAEFLDLFDFYNNPNRVGYNYGTEFRKIRKRSLCGKDIWLGDVKHWIVYMDLLLQAYISPNGTCAQLELPTNIDSITIYIPNIDDAEDFLIWNGHTQTVGNNSIVIERCKCTVAPVPVQQARKEVWGTKFMTYGENLMTDVEDSAAALLCQIVVDEYATMSCFEVGTEMADSCVPILRAKAHTYTVATTGDAPNETGPIKALKWDISKPFPKDVTTDCILSATLTPENLETMYEALPEKGYIIIAPESSEGWVNAMKQSSFSFIASVQTASGFAVLGKKILKAACRERITSWTQVEEGKAQIFVNNNKLANPAGMVKSIRAEGRDLIYSSHDSYPVDLDMVINLERSGKFGTDVNVAVSRKEVSGATVDNMELIIENPGRLDTLCFRSLPKGDIQIKYGCLNYKDLMIMVGKLQLPGLPVGFEFAGVDSSGQKVIGFGYKQGHYAKSCNSKDLDFLIPVRGKMSLKDAATIPVVYATCYEALVVRANIQKGQTILIHSCTGGIGHAAVSIAKFRGLEIYATCSNAKRDYAINELGIKPENLGNSRDESFYEMIKNATDGEGVDIVLNSLAGDKLLKSVDLVKEFGHFCEIGKYDYQQGTPISMGLFKENISFHLIDLSNYGRVPSKCRVLMDLLEKGIVTGEVKPLPVKVYGVEQIEDAIDFMGKSRHIGKVVVEMKFESEKSVDVVQKYRTRGTHLITGGLGGFGLELANWLAKNGAQKIVLTSRSGIRNGWQKMNVREMEKYSKVVIETRSINSKSDATKILKSCGDIKGIWHLAGVLRDAPLDKMTEEKWNLVVNTKMQAVYLNQASKDLNVKLQTFCMFSSVSNRFGNFGQANYAYGNSICEEVCYERQAEGKHACAIQWGVIGDVGMAQNLVRDGGAVNEGLSEPLPINACLEHLHTILNTNEYSVFLCNREHVADDNSGATLSERILGMLGFCVEDVNKSDTLEELGLDSLQNARVLNMLLAAGKQATSNTVKELTVADLVSFDE